MTGQIVIGISGFGGNGKTSVSDLLIQNHGFRRVSFADKIRAMIMALGVPEEVLRDPVKKHEPHVALCGRSPVHAMETLGTKWGRDLMHPQFWMFQFLRDGKDKPFLICDDVRFQNELDLIKEMGGITYRLIVPGKEPVRNTDFEVQKLEGTVDIVNVIGVTRLKQIYEFIYARSFGQTNKEFGPWVDQQAVIRAE